MKTPDNYIPDVTDLFWLITESPRYRLLFEEIREGRATAEELAKVLWPSSNINKIHKYTSGLSPIKYLKEILDFEAKPCSMGGSGILIKKGNDYILDDCYCNGRERPYNLSRWPSSN